MVQMVQVSIVSSLEGRKMTMNLGLEEMVISTRMKRASLGARATRRTGHRENLQVGVTDLRTEHGTSSDEHPTEKDALSCLTPLISRLPQSATSNSRERSPPAAGTNVLTRESGSPQKCLEVLC